MIQKEIQKTIKYSDESNNTEGITKMINKLKKMRTSGLEKGGELSDENIIYKVIRSRGYLQKLFDKKYYISDKNLSEV